MASRGYGRSNTVAARHAPLVSLAQQHASNTSTTGDVIIPLHETKVESARILVLDDEKGSCPKRSTLDFIGGFAADVANFIRKFNPGR